MESKSKEFSNRVEDNAEDEEDDDEDIDEDAENDPDAFSPEQEEDNEEEFNLDAMDNLKLMDMSQFTMILLDKGVTTKVTPLRRVNYFRYLVFMGNGFGVIGYGKGRAMDPQVAMDKAVENCKKNLITISLDMWMTFPQERQAQYAGMTFKLYSNRTFNSWGNPIIGVMLTLTGLSHCGFAMTYRNFTYYNFLYLYFRCVTTNLTTRELGEIAGRKIYQLSHGKRFGFGKGNLDRL